MPVVVCSATNHQVEKVVGEKINPKRKLISIDFDEESFLFNPKDVNKAQLLVEYLRQNDL